MIRVGFWTICTLTKSTLKQITGRMRTKGRSFMVKLSLFKILSSSSISTMKEKQNLVYQKKKKQTNKLEVPQ